MRKASHPADPVATAKAAADQVKSDEAARIAGVVDPARVPDDLAEAIVSAPARGAFKIVRPHMVVPQGDSGVDFAEARHRVMIVADVFDRMAQRAARRGKGCGLTLSQVEMGRLYRNLTELHQAGADPRSCLSDRAGGGVGVADIAGATMDLSRRLDGLHRRVGNGIARDIRKRSKGQRIPVKDRHLVDAVCLGDLEVSDVARSCGWVGANGHPNGDLVKGLTGALAGILDRMMGPVRGAPMPLRAGEGPTFPDGFVSATFSNPSDDNE